MSLFPLLIQFPHTVSRSRAGSFKGNSGRSILIATLTVL